MYLFSCALNSVKFIQYKNYTTTSQFKYRNLGKEKDTKEIQ